MHQKIRLACYPLLACLVFSCTSTKDVVYFQDADQFETLVDDNTFTSKFKVDDLVSIHVSTALHSYKSQRMLKHAKNISDTLTCTSLVLGIQ